MTGIGGIVISGTVMIKVIGGMYGSGGDDAGVPGQGFREVPSPGRGLRTLVRHIGTGWNIMPEKVFIRSSDGAGCKEYPITLPAAGLTICMGDL